METTHIKRFNYIDRGFHFFLILTFLIQAITGFSRLFFPTAWGKVITSFLGGYNSAFIMHKWAGGLMICGFIVHTLYLFSKIDGKKLKLSFFGPDSIIPNFKDLKIFKQMILWFFGMGEKPQTGRWSYWEKFDYWAVYWGIPLLGITGLMLIYPVFTSRYVPGWTLNIAALFHKAEAILAVSYVFIVHFYVGHLRPQNFPMNEAMFAGTVSMEEVEDEKPEWIEQLRKEGNLEDAKTTPPSSGFRVLYTIFGYAAVLSGLYILINGIINSNLIALH